MKSCLAEALLAGFLMAACTNQPPGPAPRALLAGEWVDLAKTTTLDTMVWVLEPNGTDRLLRIHVDTAPDGRIAREEHLETYGRWSIGTLGADSTRAALCVNRRSGRQGASCSPFRLDTLPADSGGRRRLEVAGYQGRHHTSALRVLIERRP